MPSLLKITAYLRQLAPGAAAVYLVLLALFTFGHAGKHGSDNHSGRSPHRVLHAAVDHGTDSHCRACDWERCASSLATNLGVLRIAWERGVAVPLPARSMPRAARLLSTPSRAPPA